MVPTISIVAMAVSALICIGAPVAAFVLYYKKERHTGMIQCFFAGVLAFFVSQFMIRIPILSVVQSRPDVIAWSEVNFVLYGVILAFTAGLFETGGRFLAAKLLMRGKLDLVNSVSAGLGHGGCESIGLTGITMIGNIFLSLCINSGLISSMGLTAEQLGGITAALADTPSYMFLVAAFERILAMSFHTAMFVLLVAFMRKGRNGAGFWTVTLCHAAFDTIAVMLGKYAGILPTYIALTPISALCVYYVAKKAKLEKQAEAQATADGLPE